MTASAEAAPSILAEAQRAHSSLLDNPDSLAAHLQSSQSERWQRFHALHPKILVIDDNSRTGERLRTGLQVLYGSNVNYVNDPRQALELIRSAGTGAQPYDALVLDLHMPGMTGTQLLKELGSDCPAVVVNTASMMSPVLADLKLQMDDFSAERVAALIAEHVEDRRPSGLPLAAIFINLKDRGWKALVDKIDAALLLKEEIPDYSSANAAFIEVFEPKLIPVTFTSLSIHQLVEEFRNALAEIQPLIAELKESFNLTETSWWKTNGESLEGALASLGLASFSSVMRENPLLTWGNVHSLLGDFIDLSPAGLAFTQDWMAEEVCDNWLQAYRKYHEVINLIANGMRSYVHDQVDIPSILDLSAMNHGISLKRLGGLEGAAQAHLISDENNLIRAFLDEACVLFGKRVAAAVNGDNVWATINLIPELQRLGEAPSRTKALKTIGAGDYFEIVFIDKLGQSFDMTFSALVPKLSQLRTAGKLAFQSEGDPGSDCRFFILIKAAEPRLELEAYKCAIASASAEYSQIIPELGIRQNVKIYSARGKDNSITCIGELPQLLDLHCELDKLPAAQGMVYRYGAETLFASAGTHKDASALILEYLQFREGDESGAKTRASALSVNDIYKDGVRISVFNRAAVNIECGAQSDKAEHARDALIDLGLLPGRAVISDRYFIAPKALPRLVEAGAAEPAIPSERMRAFPWFEYDQFLAKLRSNIDSDGRMQAFESTIAAYEAIARGPKIDEPSFIIRSRLGLSLSEQKKLCSALYALMPSIDLSAWEIVEYDSRVYIQGDCARKSGLYLFDPAYQGRKEEFSSCMFSNRLSALIEGASSVRLGREGIAYLNAKPLPANSLIFGGGDHSLSGCKAQWGLALALESILQEQQIPYDSCRGTIFEPAGYHYFNGELFVPREDPKAIFEDYIFQS